jgi:hypothetical protein
MTGHMALEMEPTSSDDQGKKMSTDIEPLASAPKFSILFGLICFLPPIFGKQMNVASLSTHKS